MRIIVFLGLAFFVLVSSASAANHLYLYRRSDFTDQASRFDPGVTVYIRAELDFSPDDEASAKLRRHDNSEAASVNLNREVNGASGLITLPNETGSYTLELAFRGHGSSYQVTKNITVGNSDHGQNVQISITNVLRPSPGQGESSWPATAKGGYPGGTQRESPILTPLPTLQPARSPAGTNRPTGTSAATVVPAPSPEESPLISPAPEMPQSRWQRWWQSLVNLGRSLRRILRSVGLG